MNYSTLIKTAETKAIDNSHESSAAIILAEYASGMKSTELYLNLKNEVPIDVEKKFNELFNKYIYDNIPVQYLVEKSCFYGYDFYVNKDVLIPRFETEELVENVIRCYDEYFKGEVVEVLDVATGSGCIGITLALEEKNMKVTATDISDAALMVAKKNALDLKAHINFIKGDMLEPVLKRKFDIVVSNPPYIPESENVESLVKDNEPNIALFGGEDGMKFYKIILKDVKKILNKKAIVAFEHGFDKKEEMIALVNEYLPNAKVEVLKDLAGKDRMTLIYVMEKIDE